MRGDVQNRLSTEALNSYSPVFQWAIVRLLLILQCILGLQSQIIDFTNYFSQADIPIGNPVTIELPRSLKSDGGQYDIILRLKKILYVQAKDECLWYENLQNGLLDQGFVASKADNCMFMPKTVICVVYLYYCMFWAHS